MRTNSEIKALILKWAYAYANSGEFEDYSEIERKLKYEDGYSEARTILDDDFIRVDLNRICSEDKNKGVKK